MKNLHSNVNKGMKSLKEKLDKALEARVVADNSITDDMEAIMSDGNKSRGFICWQQQLNALSKRKTRKECIGIPCSSSGD